MRVRRMMTAGATAACVALSLAACGGGNADGAGDTASPDGGGAADDAPVTLTISTFGEWGYQILLDEYMSLHPNVTIEHRRFATSDEAREVLTTSLAAGSGLADIVGVDNAWMPQLVDHSEHFIDMMTPSVEGRWHDWTTDIATTPDGKLLGYATDLGPRTIVYRADLFEAAGLPSDREAVAELFGGENATWDDFFRVGRQFMDAGTGPAFVDSAQSISSAMLDQLAVPFEDPDTGEVIATTNADVKDIFTKVLENTDLTSGMAQWSADWFAGFQNDAWAMMLAPSWMLGVIQGNADGVTGWDVANVFPDGGVNSGGSYLAVPAMSENQEAAKALADWLTAPEQQLKVFAETGNFPSQIAAQESDEVLGVTNEFFNDAPVGQILSDRSAAISVVSFKGLDWSAIAGFFNDAVNRVAVDGVMSSEDSWDRFVSDVESLG